jgi:hypothetical protein
MALSIEKSSYSSEIERAHLRVIIDRQIYIPLIDRKQLK